MTVPATRDVVCAHCDTETHSNTGIGRSRDWLAVTGLPSAWYRAQLRGTSGLPLQPDPPLQVSAVCMTPGLCNFASSGAPQAQDSPDVSEELPVAVANWRVHPSHRASSQTAAHHMPSVWSLEASWGGGEEKQIRVKSRKAKDSVENVPRMTWAYSPDPTCKARQWLLNAGQTLIIDLPDVILGTRLLDNALVEGRAASLGTRVGGQGTAGGDGSATFVDLW